MKRQKYIGCKNEDAHVARMEMTPDNNIKWVSGSFVVDDMAYHYGWQKTTNGWLCPDCIKEE